MEPERKSILLLIAAGLIFLLGITRGIGGIINLLNDENTLESLNNSITSLAFLIVGFIVLSAAAFITAIAIFEHNKKYLLSGILLTIIFVVSGAVNRNFLYDEITILDTIINIIVAVIIISLLMLGKRTLDKNEEA